MLPIQLFQNSVKHLFVHGFQLLITGSMLVIWLRYHEFYPSLLPVLIGILSVLLAILEWWFPARPYWKLTKKEFVQDMFYQLGIYFIYGPFIAALTAQFFIGYMGTALNTHHWAIWPTQWPLLPKIFLALLTTEFFSYWFHRAEHRFHFLWRFHSVHHSPNKMGWSKTAINHPLEYVVLVAIGVIPAALLGADVPELEGAILIYLVTTLFAHCNLTLNYRFLSILLTTNRYHLRHHSPLLSESISNYGCALVIWDRVFGTFQGYKSCEQVGIEPRENLTLLQQLILPFRSMTLGTAANDKDSTS